jgi:hypothetical protein
MGVASKECQIASSAASSASEWSRDTSPHTGSRKRSSGVRSQSPRESSGTCSVEPERLNGRTSRSRTSPRLAVGGIPALCYDTNNLTKRRWGRETRSPTPRLATSGSKLPLLGSNQDSPDPESDCGGTRLGQSAGPSDSPSIGSWIPNSLRTHGLERWENCWPIARTPPQCPPSRHECRRMHGETAAKRRHRSRTWMLRDSATGRLC